MVIEQGERDVRVTVISAPRYRPGSLVRARGRDWVVLPSVEFDVIRLRPLTGSDSESIGIFAPIALEPIAATEFPPIDPRASGDATSGLLLTEAARLSLRSGAAPFRSLSHISVAPRPYQFVPLIMALRLDPVRLLIADDVGVGKTVEAGLIARELLDRGDVRRLAIVCPAHLCEQWAKELAEKFSIDATIIGPSTLSRLERALPRNGMSVYEYYPHVIVSIDWVKSDRNRLPFLQRAPDLVIIDEAHMCARPPGTAERSQHQRYDFVRELASDQERHVVLVTATPHSGVDESFRSLLGLLNPSFDRGTHDSLDDLDRGDLLPHIVQRRRGDLERWLGTTTPFPKRNSTERTYTLSAPYRKLFDDMLTYCRETAKTGSGLRVQQQRVRYWAAIALLRCILSSPKAAESALSKRANGRTSISEESSASTTDIDAQYRFQVLDTTDGEVTNDLVPHAPIEDAYDGYSDAERRRLAGFLKQAKALAGPQNDAKLAAVIDELRTLLRKGSRPIVFCHYIATAQYLADYLPKALANEFAGVRVLAVTGEIGDDERRERIDDLISEPVRVLVATDCVSEGINLQGNYLGL